MNAERQRMLDALEVLEALKPYQGTGWEPALFEQAWHKAQVEAEAAVRAWLGAP